mmetsp:Transcript_12159/g.31146  ORF Transcript_12159/g.31146 Transcript_12159/m.31146 type:complete len:362 (+) Transcript_12159:65-1150(+)
MRLSVIGAPAGQRPPSRHRLRLKSAAAVGSLPIVLYELQVAGLLQSVALDDGLNRGHVRGLVHPVCAVVHDDGLDLVPVFDALELLQVLHQLQRRAGHGGVRLEEAGVVALQAEVQQIGLVLVGLGEALHHAVLVVRDHAARKVDGIAVLVSDALDAAAHGHLVVLERRACSAVHGVGGRLQRGDHLIDNLRLDERFVTLDVDADVKLAAQALHCLRAALCAVGDGLVGHHHFRAVLPADGGDALVIGCHHHLIHIFGLHRLHPRADDHGLAGDGHQRLAREAGRLVARRDHTHHARALLAKLGLELAQEVHRQDGGATGDEAENHLSVLGGEGGQRRYSRVVSRRRDGGTCVTRNDGGGC